MTHVQHSGSFFRRSIPGGIGALAALAVACLPAGLGCRASTHPTEDAHLGTPARGGQLEAVMETPGPIEVQTVVAVDWAVPRSGLINLDHPRAKAAGLTDGDEPIQVFVHVLRHPTRGVFLVDSGVARRVTEDPAEAGVGFAVRKVMHLEKMKMQNDTASVLRSLHQPLAGVLLTHLHLDHIMGLPDVPPGTPIFAGPGETKDRAFLFMFSQGSIDALVKGQSPLREWQFQPDPDHRFAGVLDVFGDGSLWALWVPGHTAGSTAYLARTPHGPVLMTGDASHTRWGWEHDVEPGTYSFDRPRSAESLATLRALVARHPRTDVRLGHQR
jgi:glyoxylase-like metal-dependent hydrolase (beta-lactamase superfamily II)